MTVEPLAWQGFEPRDYWSTVEDSSSSTSAFSYYTAILNLDLKSTILLNQKYTFKHVKSPGDDDQPPMMFERKLDHRSATVAAWYFLRQRLSQKASSHPDADILLCEAVKKSGSLV